MDRAELSAALVLCGSLLLSSRVGAQDSSAYPLFADQSPLELKITAPFDDLSDDDSDARPEYDAVIEFPGPDGENAARGIEIRIRGKSRVANCSFPPLSLDFTRRDVSGTAFAGTLFAGQNRLKLVTLCEPRDAYRDYLAQEFLIYRMLNALTDRSFRVRWATVEFVYSDDDRDPLVEPAFLIEEDWEVAERLGMEVVEAESLSVSSLDPEYTTLLTIFQYLIGNTDWAVIQKAPGEDSCCHNGKVIASGGVEPFVVLPYDFDNAGLINAAYAVPSDRLRIRRVTQRLYRGFCVMNDEVEGAIEAVDGERARLLAILDDERLSERGRERAMDFVSDSYEILNDPRDRERRIYEDCRRGN